MKCAHLLWTALLLAGCATLPSATTQDTCAPTAQFAFACGAMKPEDLAHIPQTPWIIASGFATGAVPRGAITAAVERWAGELAPDCPALLQAVADAVQRDASGDAPAAAP